MTSMGSQQMTQFSIGIDVSKATLEAHRLPDGEHRCFTNDKTGHRALLRWIQECPPACVVYEPTGSYHRPMEAVLAEAGLPLVKVNPRQARRFAEVLGTLAKTDPIDAAMLAHMGITLALEPRPVADEQLITLRELLTARRALIKDQTAAKNRQKILTVTLLVRQAATRLRQIKTQITAIDTAIHALMAADPVLARRLDILQSIPGIGDQAALALLIELPELGTLDGKQAASLAGLAPRTRQSGKWTGRAFVWGGRRSLRNALYMPALVAARFNPDLKEKYEQLKKSGKPPKLAITALMRKIVVLANTLIKADRKWAPMMA